MTRRARPHQLVTADQPAAREQPVIDVDKLVARLDAGH
jgi:hypothetical protein